MNITSNGLIYLILLKLLRMAKLKNQVHKEELEEITFIKKMSTSHFNYYFG